VGNAIERVILCFGESYINTFLDIVVWYERTRKKRLEEYYFNTEMETAERYWGKKEYSKAKEIYLKYESQLSESQLKKLRYIVNREEHSLK